MNTLKRWYYLIFKRDRCMRIIMKNDPYKYGDILRTPGHGKVMYLGNSWCLINKTDERYRIGNLQRHRTGDRL